MGSAHDIMQTFTGRDLHAQFPEYDGWKWRDLPAAKNGALMYRIERGYYPRHQEAVIAVSFECKPSEGSLLALLSADADKSAGRYLLVPQGADVSNVPAGIRLLSMAAFGFLNGKLTWLTKKKNAVFYPPEERSQDLK
jgi:hypothetical protein